MAACGKLGKRNSTVTERSAWVAKNFEKEGFRACLLKGQGLALCYPDPSLRYPGDIDIWVEGGKKSVMALLRKMGMMQDLSITEDDSHASVAYHHVHLPVNEHGVTVEVHFRPSPGNYNPLTTRRLQRWLEKEIQNLEEILDSSRRIRKVMIKELEEVSKKYAVPRRTGSSCGKSPAAWTP